MAKKDKAKISLSKDSDSIIDEIEKTVPIDSEDAAESEDLKSKNDPEAEDDSVDEESEKEDDSTEDDSDNDEESDDNEESDNDEESDTENTSGSEDPDSKFKKASSEITKSQTADPKGGNNSVLLIIILFLGIVIIFLIVFLIKSLNSKKSENTNTDLSVTPTTTIEITVPTDAIAPTDTDSDIIETLPGRPEFDVSVTVGEYKGISADYDLKEVTEEDIQGELDYFMETLEQQVDITDRPLKEGDIIIMDFVGTMDGEVFDGGSATGYEYELGSGRFIPGFEEGLIGKNVGDSISLDLTFPDPYTNNPDLSGKPVNFLVNINSAYEYVIPELTDELVQENTELSSVEELMTEIRKELESYEEQSAESAFKYAVIEKLIASSTFSGQIDEEIAYEESQAIAYYDSIGAQYGVDGATLFGYYYGMTEEEYYAMAHEEAEMSIKYSYVLNEIAKLEGFTVSDEEREKAFNDYFIDYLGYTDRDDVLQRFTEEELDKTLETNILQEKAEAVIFDNAIKNTNSN